MSIGLHRQDEIDGREEKDKIKAGIPVLLSILLFSRKLEYLTSKSSSEEKVMIWKHTVSRLLVVLLFLS